jgi:protein SCO1/2
MNNLQKKALLLTVILAAVTTLTYLYSSRQPDLPGGQPVAKLRQHNNLTLFPVARDILPFEFQDQNKLPFNNDRLLGKWNLLFFGFTHCPDICPPTLYQLKTFLDQLGNVPGRPQVVFISVDPQRDTPEVIREYLERFHPDFIGAVGSETDLVSLAKQLGIYFEKSHEQSDPHAGHEQHGQAKNYSINHSGSVLVVNPKGQLAGLFSMPHEADKMVDAWQKLLPADGR